VTYYHVDMYLSTISKLEKLRLESLHTGHWPSMYGDEVGDFFSTSRQTVELLDRSILGALNRHRLGLTLNELIDEARDLIRILVRRRVLVPVRRPRHRR